MHKYLSILLAFLIIMGIACHDERVIVSRHHIIIIDDNGEVVDEYDWCHYDDGSAGKC